MLLALLIPWVQTHGYHPMSLSDSDAAASRDGYRRTCQRKCPAPRGIVWLRDYVGRPIALPEGQRGVLMMALQLEQVDFFRTNGSLPLPGLFPVAHVEAL